MPVPYRAFAKERIALRRGQVSLVVAAPGVGKTAFALDVAKRSAPHRAFYFCVDTDPLDMTGRAIASVTGEPVPRDEGDLGEYVAYFRPQLAEAMGHVTWCFDGGPSVSDVFEEVECYGAVYGAYPELVTVDNLTSLELDGEMGYTAIQEALSQLNQLARESGAHVMVLHHATGLYEDGDKPIPLSGVEQKAGKRVAMVLTMTRMGSSLRVYPVKNRGGKADARAHHFVSLTTDLARMRVDDIPEAPSYG